MKPGYYQFRLTEENRAHLEAIARALGLDPDEWGSKSKAVNFALRATATGLVKGERDEQHRVLS